MTEGVFSITGERIDPAQDNDAIDADLLQQIDDLNDILESLD